MKSLIILSALIATTTAVAIPKTQTQTPPPPKNFAPTIAQLGEPCGGIPSDAPTCAEDLTCVPIPSTTSNPNEDQFGVCMHIGTLGDACLGASLQGEYQVCEEGFSCYDPSFMPHINGGTCQQVGILNEACGGFMGSPCAEGLSCYVEEPEGGIIMNDAIGMCKNVVGEGAGCGMGDRDNICDHGLECVNRVSPTLARRFGGICKKKAGEQ
ncbi:hypothetical protein HDV05_006485 [Chytridiales sp. JEL 0842]|nr:hypothetical protein HDV05_006485 [Chytridiales sp. JEL 0842]